MRPSYVVTLALLAATQASAQTSIPEILAGISEKRIEANIRKLASFGTRNSLSTTDDEKRGIGAARRWIKAELERCSAGTPLQVAFDENRVESGSRVPRPTNFVNVVATLPGAQPESRRSYLRVSGHYDSMPSSPTDGEKDAPGANDDPRAPGSWSPPAMSRYKFNATIVFMAVAGGQGLSGRLAGRRRRKKNPSRDVPTTSSATRAAWRQGGRQPRARFRRGRARQTRCPTRVGGQQPAVNDLPTRQLARYIRKAAK